MISSLLPHSLSSFVTRRPPELPQPALEPPAQYLSLSKKVQRELLPKLKKKPRTIAVRAVMSFEPEQSRLQQLMAELEKSGVLPTPRSGKTGAGTQPRQAAEVPVTAEREGVSNVLSVRFRSPDGAPYSLQKLEALLNTVIKFAQSNKAEIGLLQFRSADETYRISLESSGEQLHRTQPETKAERLDRMAPADEWVVVDSAAVPKRKPRVRREKFAHVSHADAPATATPAPLE